MTETENKVEITFEDFKAEVLNDYKIAVTSRECSLLGRREVLTGKAKFGIFGDGKEVQQLALAKAFKDIDVLKCASYDQLIEVEEIGEKIAISVIDFFSIETNSDLIERLKKVGLCFTKENEVLDSTALLDKTIVISGSFSVFSRDELKELIEKNGGKVGSSVSSNSDYLVAGENVGPAKLKKATTIGVKIISEEEFVKLISL